MLAKCRTARSGAPALALALLLFVPAATGAARSVRVIASRAGGLLAPGEVALDRAGNLYVEDRGSGHVFRIDASGTPTRIGGCPGASESPLDRIEGMAVAAPGRLVVSCSRGVFRLWGNAVPRPVVRLNRAAARGIQLVVPAAVAAHRDGSAWVAGLYSHNVVHVPRSGAAEMIIGLEGDGAGNRLYFPEGLAVDRAGNVSVAGASSHNVFRIDRNGAIRLLIDATGDGRGHELRGPKRLALGPGGTVYVTGMMSDNAFAIDPSGAIREIIDATGDGKGHVLRAPVAIAVDAAGTVYVGGTSSDNVFAIEPSGRVVEILDASGDGAGAVLDAPAGIAVDAAGNVIVAGERSGNVFRIAPPAAR